MKHPDGNRIEWQRLRDNGEICVLLIRHGQTEWNKERRFLGRTDIPLNETGHFQAAQLAGSLCNIPISAIYSSPLLRAWGTAQAIATDRGLEPIVVDGLTELNQGDLEGLYGADLKRDFPDFYREWINDPTDVRIPGGETLAECTRRAVDSFFTVVSRHQPGNPIAIVSHKVAISGIICEALGRPVRSNMEIEQHNTAVNLLGVKHGLIHVHKLNDFSHLNEATVQP